MTIRKPWDWFNNHNILKAPGKQQEKWQVNQWEKSVQSYEKEFYWKNIYSWPIKVCKDDELC